MRSVNFQFYFWCVWLLLYNDGCTNGQLSSLNSEFQIEKQKYQINFVSHFPDSLIEGRIKLLTSEDLTISHPKIWLKMNLSASDLEVLKNKSQIAAIKHYGAMDTCLLVIDRHLNEQNHLIYEKNLRVGPRLPPYSHKCDQSDLPIPKFWAGGWCETGRSPVCLSEDFELFVLDAKSGLFLDEKDLPNGKYMPIGWEHGYSKGLAINSKQQSVIYWFDIW